MSVPYERAAVLAFSGSKHAPGSGAPHSPTKYADTPHTRTFDAAPAASYLFDARGTVLRVNAAGARLLSRPPEVVTGTAFRTYLAADQAGRFAAHLKAVTREGGLHRCRLVVHPEEGPVRALHLQSRAVEVDGEHACWSMAFEVASAGAGDEGSPEQHHVRTLAALLDRTCRVLRVPMASMVGFIELLQEGVFTGKEEIVGQIGRRSRRLLGNLHAMQDLARLLQASPAAPGTIDVGALLHAKMQALAPQVEARGARLEVVQPRAPVPVRAVLVFLDRLLYYFLRHLIEQGVPVRVEVRADAQTGAASVHAVPAGPATFPPRSVPDDPSADWSLDLAIATYLADVSGGTLDQAGGPPGHLVLHLPGIPAQT